MAYKLKPSDGGPIEKDKAKKWMKNYEKKHPDGIKGYFFGQDIIQKIIDQPEAVGMRVYLCYGDEDKLQMVLVGSREDGSDLWPEASGKDGGTNGIAADTGVPCPPYCSS